MPPFTYQNDDPLGLPPWVSPVSTGRIWKGWVVSERRSTTRICSGFKGPTTIVRFVLTLSPEVELDKVTV